MHTHSHSHNLLRKSLCLEVITSIMESMASYLYCFILDCALYSPPTPTPPPTSFYLPNSRYIFAKQFNLSKIKS